MIVKLDFDQHSTNIKRLFAYSYHHNRTWRRALEMQRMAHNFDMPTGLHIWAV